jgi:aspartyl-tRNA(Asn)/glutamyl-tRNA(Gln) amidotransferase subunit B
MAVATETQWETVIGLEVHAQIQTASKMYCSCPVETLQELAQANKYVCPICLGHPGTLPRPNRQAVVHGLTFALKVGAAITERSVFARKNYFYPDLPKGYQITQFDLPLALGGSIPYWQGQERRSARLTRMHLEEDTAKLFHLEDGTAALDYGRAGVPLMEIVSEPDFRSAEQCVAYLDELRSLLRRLNISEAAMEAGNFRCEPNVSVRPVGSSELRTKTELKNLNSFTKLRRAVEAETARQIGLYESGGEVHQATMRYDEARGVTVPMRLKESSHDYRYFEDPDIPPLVLTPGLLEEARVDLHSSGYELRDIMVHTDGLTHEQAATLIDDDVLYRWYRNCCLDGHAPPEVAKWVVGDLTRLLRDAPLQLEPGALSEVLTLLNGGQLSLPQAREVFREIYASGETAADAMNRLGITGAASSDELEAHCLRAIDANPKSVADYRGGKKTALQSLLGQVMRESRGSADPQQALQTLERLLG